MLKLFFREKAMLTKIYQHIIAQTYRKFFCLWLFFLSSVALALPQALPPEKAFSLTINKIDQHTLRLSYQLAPGYYLYRDQFTFASNPEGIIGKPSFSQAQIHQDEFFGKQAIFRHRASIDLSINKQQFPFQLKVVSRGCADIGVCYPPYTRFFTITKYKVESPLKLTNIDQGSLRTQILQTTTQPYSGQKNTDFFLVPAKSMSHSSSLIDQKHLLRSLLFFLLAGLAMSLTACMYPLIPVISSVILYQQGTNDKRHFLSTFFYVQGIAVSYMILGIIAAVSGVLLSAYLQRPIFIFPASLLIVILALAMFDVFHLQLPSCWQNRFQNVHIHTRFHLLTIFLMGALSALVIGPCVAPPLAFALAYIGTSQDILFGSLALYTMGIGLGLPFIVFSLIGSRFLPKAGHWMVVIKRLLGVVLLVVAVYLTSTFLPAILLLYLYSLLFLLPLAIFFCYPAATLWGKTSYLLFSFVCLGAVILLNWNYYKQQDSSLNVFLSLTHQVSSDKARIVRYTDPNDLLTRIKQELKNHPNKPIYLDVYAAWCQACREMEKYTFSNPQVQQELNKGLFLQLDMTENTQEHRTFLSHFHLYAPPAFLVIKAPNHYGNPLVGTKQAKEFLNWLKKEEEF